MTDTSNSPLYAERAQRIFYGAYNFYVNGKYVEYSTLYSGHRKVGYTDELYRAQRYFDMYRFHITAPIYFKEDLKVPIQSLGLRRENRYLPLQDDIFSVAYWYSDNLEYVYPSMPTANSRKHQSEQNYN